MTGTCAPTPVLVVAFGAPPPAELLRGLPAHATRVLADAAPPAGFEWQPLSASLALAAMDEALALLQQLNALRGADGTQYAQTIRYHGYEPWWCHQQTAFDGYLRPFVRYLPLLLQCVAADRIIICDCPPELRRLLLLVPVRGRVQFREVAVKPLRLRRVRQLGSALFYRTCTTLAVARAVVDPPHDIVFTFGALDRNGRNPWIDGLYQSLARRGTSYLEVVWSPSGTQAVRHWRRRRRFAAFCQAIAPGPGRDLPAAAPASHTTTFASLSEQFLHNLATRVLLPRARYSCRAIRRYERFLRKTRPRGAYFMDDYVHGFELLLACRRRGIATVAVQHGQFSRYKVGLMGYGFTGSLQHSFDRYCVWGDHFQQLLARHSSLVPSESVIVAGSPRGDQSNAPATSAAEVGVVLFLAESYEAAVQQREVSPYVQALAAAGLDVRIKLHPSMTQTPILSRDRTTGRAARVVEGRLEQHLGRATVVVGSFSSAIFEAVLHERPVVLFTTSVYQDPHGLAQTGLAEIATSPADIVARVAAAAQLPPAELKRRRELVWGRDSRDGGDVAVAEMDALQALSARQPVHGSE